MPRARVIYNPTSGRELIPKRMMDILRILEEAGYEASCKATEGKGSASIEAEKACASGVDVVIAAGGDGTIHEVVNGLVKFPAPPKLGILPGGTTNDFARALKIPRNLIKACDIIAQGRSKHIDLGFYGQGYFINVAAVGHLTEISGTHSSLKTVVGPFAYYMKVVENLGKIAKPFPAKIVADHGVIEDEIILLVIANSVSVGGFSRLTPLAELDDGLLDVLILPKITIPNILQIAALATKAEHINDPKVIYFQTSSLDVTIPDKLKFNLDGEHSDVSSGIFKADSLKIEVFCP